MNDFGLTHPDDDMWPTEDEQDHGSSGTVHYDFCGHFHVEGKPCPTEANPCTMFGCTHGV